MPAFRRNGNLLGQSDCTTYAYNAENQLVSTAGVTYTYDGDGKRVKADQTSGSTYDRLYWFGLGIDALAESDLSGTLTDEYVFFGGKRVARRNVSSGNIFYYFADHLGTSRTIVQAGQTSPCYDADFYPYGGERVVTNTCPQKYKFTGKERDGESGLDNFGARYDSSWMGRFLSPDEFPGGIVDPFSGHAISQPGPLPYADVSDPQTLNKYAYTRNNPLRWTDPDGHCFFGIDSVACAVYVAAATVTLAAIGVHYFIKSLDDTLNGEQGKNYNRVSQEGNDCAFTNKCTGDEQKQMTDAEMKRVGTAAILGIEHADLPIEGSSEGLAGLAIRQAGDSVKGKMIEKLTDGRDKNLDKDAAKADQLRREAERKRKETCRDSEETRCR